MPSTIAEDNPLNEELNLQYNDKYILICERAYGRGWAAAGGESWAKDCFMKLKLRPGQKVLDIGSGIGGAATYMARQYAVNVQGIDYSNYMIDLANERLSREDESLKKRVSFKFGDISKMEYGKGTFDAIYSAGVFLHINDKEHLFNKIKDWLKPGGRLLIVDYCFGDSKLATLYRHRLLSCTYQMCKMEEYSEKLKKCGFNVIEATDTSDDYVNITKREIKHFQSTEEASIEEFGQKLYDYVVYFWNLRVKGTEEKELKWSLFLATCPPTAS